MHFFIYYILPFVVVLGTLIFFHELGHFLLAKSFGVKVLKFSLGFGPKLVGKKVGDTEYVVSALPLGGRDLSVISMCSNGSPSSGQDPCLICSSPCLFFVVTIWWQASRS